MPRRLNTIIVVPHSKAKFFKLSFSTRALVVGLCLALVALALSVIAIGYTGSAVSRRAEVERLQAENRQLAEVNRQLEATIAEVQSRLDEFEERTSRLALAAGMEAQVGGSGGEEGPVAGDHVGSGGPYDRLPGSPLTLTLQGDLIASRLDLLDEKLTRQDEKLASTPTIAPVLGLITDGFGRRADPFTGHRSFHRGLDISARRGTPVFAPADGVVVFAGRNGGLGKTLRISHGFGYTTVYGHLDKVEAVPGTEVHRGEEIGLLGNTGRSTGPHLHYEVLVNGRAVNPLYYILDAY